MEEFSPKNILEVGPGTGELTFRLAEHRNVYALEPSHAMRSLLLTKLNKTRSYDERLSLVSSIEQVPDAYFDLVMANNVFFLLDTQEREELFKSIALKLRPRAPLVFNFLNIQDERHEKPLSLIGERKVGLIDYRHYSASTPLSANERKVTWKFQVLSGGKCLESHEEQFKVRHHSSGEIQESLNKCGYHKIDFYSDFKKTSFGKASPKPVVVASTF